MIDFAKTIIALLTSYSCSTLAFLPRLRWLWWEFCTPYSSLFQKLFSLYCARPILEKGSRNYLVEMCGLCWLYQLIKGTRRLCVNSVASATSPREPAALFLSFFISTNSPAFLWELFCFFTLLLYAIPPFPIVSLITRFNYESWLVTNSDSNILFSQGTGLGLRSQAYWDNSNPELSS